ncbi:hypothetical protein, partial [Pseudomonas protegens]|uniref:hypothetical protein n=1 Tax=Pseudomonas protegens TaxID=380021 RepID=UPI00223BBC51
MSDPVLSGSLPSSLKAGLYVCCPLSCSACAKLPRARFYGALVKALPWPSSAVAPNRGVTPSFGSLGRLLGAMNGLGIAK